MNCVLTFSPPRPLGGSSAYSLFSKLAERCSVMESRHRHWAVVVAAAKPPEKPIFYKNPSRAIEKGGGFFIPGLQGPRLRFLVPTVATLFLSLNHVSGGVVTEAMTRSEGLGIVAALGVLGTALLDVMKTSEEPSSGKGDAVYRTAVIPEDVTSSSAMTTRTNSAQWASAVVRDLAPGIEIAHFRNNELVFGTSDVMQAKGGVAVQRVLKEQRPLYVADSSSLPENVTFPFLEAGKWSIFLIPTEDEHVVVFASREELPKDSRRWLEVLSERIAAK